MRVLADGRIHNRSGKEEQHGQRIDTAIGIGAVNNEFERYRKQGSQTNLSARLSDSVISDPSGCFEAHLEMLNPESSGRMQVVHTMRQRQ